jgi:hypothetical protein
MLHHVFLAHRHLFSESRWAYIAAYKTNIVLLNLWTSGRNPNPSQLIFQQVTSFQTCRQGYPPCWCYTAFHADQSKKGPLGTPISMSSGLWSVAWNCCVRMSDLGIPGPRYWERTLPEVYLGHKSDYTFISLLSLVEISVLDMCICCHSSPDIWMVNLQLSLRYGQSKKQREWELQFSSKGPHTTTEPSQLDELRLPQSWDPRKHYN